MICFPNAKINIGLHIINKREDGFHNIESLFYPIKLCDILEIVKNEGAETEFYNSGLKIDCKSEDNLCLKAYRLLKKDFGLPGIKMYLHKVIPFGSGLGGGSSDAAHTLILLNELFDIGLSKENLEEYSLKLGSDCAFFIRNKPVFVEGRGEQFSNTDLSLNNLFLIVLNPGIHISSKEAYSGLALQEHKHGLRELVMNPYFSWKDIITNDFENQFFNKYPLINRLKKSLYDQGAIYASMTGSGSAVYAIFKDKDINKDGFRDYIVWEGLL